MTESIIPDEVTNAQIEFWESGIRLRKATWVEFTIRQPDYGDIWMENDLDTLCGQIRAEANRIRGKMTKEKLRHRIVDLNAYLTMLYRLTEE